MSRETKHHVIVAAAALAFCLLLSAMAGPIDKGGIDFNNLRGACKASALKEVDR